MESVGEGNHETCLVYSAVILVLLSVESRASHMLGLASSLAFSYIPTFSIGTLILLAKIIYPATSSELYGTWGNLNFLLCRASKIRCFPQNHVLKPRSLTSVIYRWLRDTLKMCAWVCICCGSFFYCSIHILCGEANGLSHTFLLPAWIESSETMSQNISPALNSFMSDILS